MSKGSPRIIRTLAPFCTANQLYAYALTPRVNSANEYSRKGRGMAKGWPRIIGTLAPLCTAAGDLIHE